MKKCLPIFLMLAIFTCGASIAQTVSLQERLSESRPRCYDVTENANNVLPDLYKQSQFDSIAFVANYIEKICPLSTESFYLKLLLAIQNRSFNEREHFDTLSIINLRTCADQSNNTSKYYNRGYGSPAPFYRFIQKWATDLLQNNSLATNEIMILQVLAGQIQDPDGYLVKHSSDYPYLSSLLKAKNKKIIKDNRALLALTTGAWIPMGDLQVLGVHPTIGGLLGYHNHANEFDLNVAAKFMKSPNLYKIYRQDSVYQTDYFSGIYAGLDYTRYLVQRSNFEMGILGGVGYDGFNIADDGDDDEEKNQHLKPLTIASFNANAGLRFSYYFPRSFCIGLMARYNFVNYNNSGGTSFNGNNLTVNFVFSQANLYGNNH